MKKSDVSDLKLLSKRELQIVELSIDGLTNDAIAHRLNLSVGTVNTYWMRIRSKVGGQGRTDTVAKVIAMRNQAEKEGAQKNREQKDFVDAELSVLVTLLETTASICHTVIWTVDRNLTVQILANASEIAPHIKRFEPGQSIEDIFRPADPDDIAVKAHQMALNGDEEEVSLSGRLKSLLLRTIPIRNKSDEVLGCIGVLMPKPPGHALACG